MKLSAAENRATGLGKLGKKGAKNHLDTLHVDSTAASILRRSTRKWARWNEDVVRDVPEAKK